MRERLIELLYDVEGAREDTKADHLLRSGVIVPHLKVGQKFYHIEEYKHSLHSELYPKITLVYKDEITCIEIKKNGRIFYGSDKKRFIYEDINKTVFLTKEEAENALKERERE